MPMLSAKVLSIDPGLTLEQNVEANSQVILRVTDGFRWVCVCSGAAMTALFGAARATTTCMVEDSNVTFCNAMDSGAYR